MLPHTWIHFEPTVTWTREAISWATDLQSAIHDRCRTCVFLPCPICQPVDSHSNLSPFFLSVTVSQVSQSALHHPSLGKHRLGHFDRFVWANFPISPEFCHHKWTLVKCECTTSVSRSQGLFSHDMTCKTVTELGHVQRSNPKTSKTMKMKTRYCLIADDRHHIIHTLYNVSFKSTGSHCGKYVSKQYILWSVTVKMNAAYLSKRHMPHIFPTAKQD